MNKFRDSRLPTIVHCTRSAGAKVTEHETPDASVCARARVDTPSAASEWDHWRPESRLAATGAESEASAAACCDEAYPPTRSSCT